MKRVLFRGDDAGGCRSANEAIAEACAAGVLRNVSVMACGPAFQEAVPLLKRLSDAGVALGLHVCLNAEWEGPRWGPVMPPSEVPSLLDGDTGYFTHFPADLDERGFSLHEAVAEVTAQLLRLREAGLTVTYLDEHMGVGGIGGGSLRAALRDLCRGSNLLAAEAATFQDLIEPETAPDAPLADRWLARLTAAGAGTYRIVTHPGKDTPEMRDYFLTGGTPGEVARERDAERVALCDPRLRAGLEAAGIRSVRYDEL